VVLIAALSAANALAVDSMLPALGQIGHALGLNQANQQQWVVTAFLLAFGSAQVVYGTLTDRFGRKPVLLVSLVIYVVFSLVAGLSPSFRFMMVARVLQGIGAAGSRVIAVSIVRDCYGGRKMAQVMSLTFLVFLGVPILAPSLGQLIMLVFPWRGIFVALALYGVLLLVWIFRKLPETMHEQDRRPIDIQAIAAAFKVTLTTRQSLGYTLAAMLIFGSLFGFINASQQVFAQVFKLPGLFAVIFAGIAGSMAGATILNARLVNKMGMRMLAHTALLGFVLAACVHAGFAILGIETIWSFIILQAAMMFCFGLLAGNLSALSMEPLGHIAGTAASAQGFITGVGGAAIGFFIGQQFNGTVIPMTLGFALCGMSALAVTFITERGRLFHGGNEAALVPVAVE